MTKIFFSNSAYLPWVFKEEIDRREEAMYTKKYLVTNEVLNAITHGIGAILSIVGMVLLIMKAVNTGTTLELVSYCIYGFSQFLLYLSSTLYHSLIFTRARKIFKIFDHSSIFLLIAGAYTPIALITIGGTIGWTLFGIVWVIAIFGIIYKCLWIEKFKKMSTLLYIGMGWLSIFAVKPMYIGLGFEGFALLLAGGLSFTIGTIFYSMRNVKYMHVLWHLFVLAGTGFIYFSILLYG